MIYKFFYVDKDKYRYKKTVPNKELTSIIENKGIILSHDIVFKCYNNIFYKI